MDKWDNQSRLIRAVDNDRWLPAQLTFYEPKKQHLNKSRLNSSGSKRPGFLFEVFPQMTALIQAISNLSIAHADHETEALQMVAMFCAAGLVVSMLLASIGVDLGGEVF